MATATTRRIQGLRQSNAAGVHKDKREKRLRTRRERDRRVIREQVDG